MTVIALTAIACGSDTSSLQALSRVHAHDPITPTSEEEDDLLAGLLEGAIKIPVPLASSTAVIHKFEYPAQDQYPYHTYVSVHANETTALEAGKALVQSIGGKLIVVTNSKGQRLASFSYGNKSYRFDPNRMFTERGARLTLERYNSRRISQAVVQELVDFGRLVLAELQLDSQLRSEAPQTLIALHNNTEGRYSVLSYLEGGSESSAAESVYVNYADQGLTTDYDDFVYVTSAEHFEAFAEVNGNAILQDNESVTDDGSLSVYLGPFDTDYINVEAQHGHKRTQNRMLRHLLELGHSSQNLD